MTNILGWKINAAQLSDHVSDHLGQSLTVAQHQQVFWLANGIAARERFRTNVTGGKLDGFVLEAQVAAREGRFHILNSIDPRLAIATTVSLQQQIERTPKLDFDWSQIDKIARDRKTWADYLGKTCHVERDPLARGADALLGHYSGFIEGLNVGSTVMRYPFESPDVPLHVLVSGATELVRSIFNNRDFIDQILSPEYTEHYERNQIQIPNQNDLMQLVEWFESLLKQSPQSIRQDRHLFELLEESGYSAKLSRGEQPQFLTNLIQIFSYLASSGPSRDTRAKASQVLVMLHSDPRLELYRKRALQPLGVWNHETEFARLNPYDRRSVLDFIKSRAPAFWDQNHEYGMMSRVLGSFANNPRVSRTFRWLSGRALAALTALQNGFQKLARTHSTSLTDEQVDDAVWEIWETALKYNHQARFIITDIDHFLIDFSVFTVMALGNDYAKPMPLLISYLAWTLQNQQSVRFATQAADPRVATITNHPDLAIARISLTLRDRLDPPTTAQEISEFAGGTYTTLSTMDERLLRKFKEENCDWAKLTKPEQIQVALILTNNYRYFARGSKSQVYNQERVLLDDSMSKVQHYVAAGGRGGLVTGAHYKYHPRVIHESTELLLKATETGARIIIDLRRSKDPSFMTSFESGGVFVYHDTRVLALAHTRASRDLATLRNELVDQLSARRQYRKVMKEAKAVLDETMKSVRVLGVAADPQTGKLFLVDELNRPYKF